MILASGGVYELTPDWEKPVLKAAIMLRLYRLTFPDWMKKIFASRMFYSDTSGARIGGFLESNPIPSRRSAWITILDSFWNYEAGNLGEIDTEVLVIHGSHDKIVPVSAARETAERLSAPLRIVPETGHVPMVEKPETYTKYLRNFMDEI